MTETRMDDASAPWAMQLVLHMRKQDPPSRAELCEAAAAAVVQLLTSAEAAPGGAWHGDISRWVDGRIRKHARRARGAMWDTVQELPGMTASAGRAQVRAFPPCPTDTVPSPIRKLQLMGSEPEELGPTRQEVHPGGPLVIHICADPVLSLGKAAAAAAHAAQISLWEMPEGRQQIWAAAGYPVTVVHPDVQNWTRVREEANVRVEDGGFTEVAPNTVTAVATWR